MLWLIDLREADRALFDAYEAIVLPLVPRHGGRVEWRLRAADGTRECHLPAFADDAALAAFRADPARLAAAGPWRRSGATAVVTPVAPVAPPA